MAKKSVIAREKRRIQASKRHWETRCNLKKIISSSDSTPEEKWAAVLKLQKRPRDQSAVRVRLRCECCGRPRGVFRMFRLCRCCLRECWQRGEIPGLVKASW